jgi:hypothetical protein
VNDLLLARATFEAAAKRWPGAKITLRNGARISRRTTEPTSRPAIRRTMAATNKCLAQSNKSCMRPKATNNNKRN